MKEVKGKLCHLTVTDEGNIYWRNNEHYDEFVHPDDYKLIINTLNLNKTTEESNDINN